MSQTTAADLLVRAVARALADGRRVLLAGDDFEALQLLAGADVRELVVVSAFADPDAPAGQTASGAPLRMRNDWRERPSSKDLVVDLTGEAPPDEVARLLKKAGVYVTAAPSAASAALAHRVVFETAVSDALVAGDGDMTGVVLGRGETPGPSVVLAGKAAPEVPGVLCSLPDGAVERPGALADEVAALQKAGAAATKAAAKAEKRAERALAKATATLEKAQARAAATLVKTEARAAADLEEARAAGAAALATVEAAHAELEAEFTRVRDELAERRVNDRRVERVRERFEAARAEMTAELVSLRARLREIDEPAADFESVEAEIASLRVGYRKLATQLAKLVRRLGWPGVPAPPSRAESLDGWLAIVAATAEAGLRERKALEAQLTDTQKRLEAMAKRARELGAAVEAAKAPPPPPPPPAPSAPDAELSGRVEQLEVALAAERALRAAERVTHDRLAAAARAAMDGREALVEAAGDARREAARAQLAAAASADEARRLRAEIALREAYTGEVEAMLKTHADMQALLTESLVTADSELEQSNSARRLSDENLRILREEFELTRGRSADQ